MNLIEELNYLNNDLSIILNMQFEAYCENRYKKFLETLSLDKQNILFKFQNKITNDRFIKMLSSSSFSAITRFVTENSSHDEVINEAFLQIKEWFEYEVDDHLDNVFLCDGKFKKNEKNNYKLKNTNTILDFEFDGIWNHLDSGISKFFKYNEVEQIKIKYSITQVEEILNCFPILSKFIDLNTHIIYLRKTPERNNIGSSTNILRIGASCIRNIEYILTNPILILDLIIHENIHNYLGKYEIIHGYFVNQMSNNKIESPWTGNIIPVQAYTQACYVWFGLYNYYRLLYSKFGYNFLLPKISQAKLGIIKGLSYPILGQDNFSEKFICDIKSIEERVQFD